MNIEQYQKESIRTLAKCDTDLLDDLHMILGMQTEAAEIADLYKKHIAYGKTLDLVNLKEEIGDLMWYIANMCNLHGWDLLEILATNIEKLKARYPDKFTNEQALNRDLVKERDILEGKNNKVAVYSNKDKSTFELITYFNKSKMKSHHFQGMVYLVDKDIFVSHLNLEIHYPEYKLVNADVFLTQKIK